MTGVLAGVDQRTKLVGANRLELLLFHLGGRQIFGINVFKVKEVIQCPRLTRLVHANSVVRGVTNMRGVTISILDLALAVGKRALPPSEECFILVTEYNRTVQGFLVSSVDRIVNLKWEDIKTPPEGLGGESYMTAVTDVDGDLVEIIDVEKVLAELVGVKTELENPQEVHSEDNDRALRLLVVDDSSVARNQIKRTMTQLGIECILAKNGREGLDMLKDFAEQGPTLSHHVDAVISDVEMPEMDGYTLTTEIRKDERLKQIPILLHTSLSGVFNKNMVSQVGADKFVPKFSAEELSGEVKALLVEKGLIA